MTHEFVESDNFTIDMDFGEFIRKKRRILGLNQTDFGEMLGGYMQSTISMWELGITSPPIEEARTIIDRLGADLMIVNQENNFERKMRVNEMVDNYLRYGISQVVI